MIKEAKGEAHAPDKNSAGGWVFLAPESIGIGG
jgi:hypothetical protein